MRFNESSINLHQLVLSLSQALDLVNPVMAHHHERVAYTALRVAEILGLPAGEKEKIVIAAALHDIGALSNRERESVVRLDSGLRHARFGHQLLMKFEPFREAARLVRFHHIPWADGAGLGAEGEAVPAGAHIIHLADRIDTLIDDRAPILSQVERIVGALRALSGRTLVPGQVEAFFQLAESPAFWLELASPGLQDRLAERTPFSTIEMDVDGLLDFAGLMAQVIDFRSRHTATHSSGVAAVTATLADLFGLAEGDCKRLQVAGFLHDIGKLAIPVEVLEKPGRLSADEWLIVNAHPYHSYRVLAAIGGLEDIATWAGMHHERLTGDGYPFRARQHEIPLEARILAVADVFTALTEDRPYRAGIEAGRAMTILKELVEERKLDARVVEVLLSHYEAVDRCRLAAQAEAVQDYREFMERLVSLDFSNARATHLAWRQRLNAFLQGAEELPREYLVSHRQCGLGQWYYEEGLHQYGHVPEMQALEEPHAELHRLVAKVVDLQEQGHSAQAKALSEELQPLFERIVALLDAIEVKAALWAGGSSAHDVVHA